MELEWITPQQAANKWAISARRAQALCLNEQIEGAKRPGRLWFMPKDVSKPKDRRAKNGRTATKGKPEKKENKQ